MSLAAKSKHALISAAQLLRQYHDASTSFVNDHNLNQNLWRLPIRHPVEVICHNDYAPHNIVMQGNECIGIIDFDCAAPGSRVWDISYALYRYAPFANPNNCDGFGTIKEQTKRARLFCDSYALSLEERINLPELIIERLHSLIDFMFDRAGCGDQNFKDNIINKHHIAYKQDADYIDLNKEQIKKSLIESTRNHV